VRGQVVVVPSDGAADQALNQVGFPGAEPSGDQPGAAAEVGGDRGQRVGEEVGEVDRVVRRRVRYLDGEPFYSNDSYFRLAVAQDTAILAPHDIARGANRVVAEAGHTQVRAVDEIFVRMPTPSRS
jgi:hypothetical protein